MKRWVFVWVVFAALGASCGGGGGPAAPAFDPFGTESAPVSGAEPVGVNNDTPPPAGSVTDTVEALCGRACVHIQATCPGAISSSGCAGDCATDTFPPGCEPELKAFFRCATTASVVCQGTQVSLPACDGAAAAVGNCFNSTGV